MRFVRYERKLFDWRVWHVVGRYRLDVSFWHWHWGREECSLFGAVFAVSLFCGPFALAAMAARRTVKEMERE